MLETLSYLPWLVYVLIGLVSLAIILMVIEIVADSYRIIEQHRSTRRAENTTPPQWLPLEERKEN